MLRILDASSRVSQGHLRCATDGLRGTESFGGRDSRQGRRTNRIRM